MFQQAHGGGYADSGDDNDMLMAACDEDGCGLKDYGTRGATSAVQVRDMLSNLDSILQRCDNDESDQSAPDAGVAAVEAAAAAAVEASIVSASSASRSESRSVPANRAVAAEYSASPLGIPAWLTDLRSKIAAISPETSRGRSARPAVATSVAVSAPVNQLAVACVGAPVVASRQPAAVAAAVSTPALSLAPPPPTASALALVAAMPLDISSRPPSLHKLARRGVRVAPAPTRPSLVGSRSRNTSSSPAPAASDRSHPPQQYPERLPAEAIFRDRQQYQQQQQHDVSLSTDVTSSTTGDDDAEDEASSTSSRERRQPRARPNPDDSFEIVDAVGGRERIVVVGDDHDDNNDDELVTPAAAAVLAAPAEAARAPEQRVDRAPVVAVVPHFMQVTSAWKQHIDPTPRHIRVESLAPNDSSVGSVASAAARVAVPVSSARRRSASEGSTRTASSESAAPRVSPKQQQPAARRLGPLPSNVASSNNPRQQQKRFAVASTIAVDISPGKEARKPPISGRMVFSSRPAAAMETVSSSGLKRHF